MATTTTNILHSAARLPVINHVLALLTTLLLTLLTTLTSTPPPTNSTLNPYHLLNVTPHTPPPALTTAYHHLLNTTTTTTGWLHTLMQTLATTNNDILTNNNKPHFSPLMTEEEMYRTAYETLTDPLKRCVYHRASNTAEWYGFVPRFCWGEGRVSWLMQVKEAVGGWGASAVAAAAAAQVGGGDGERDGVGRWIGGLWWRVVAWLFAWIGVGLPTTTTTTTTMMMTTPQQVATAPVGGLWGYYSVCLSWLSAWPCSSLATWALLILVFVAGIVFLFRDRLRNASETLNWKTATVFLEFTPALLRTVLSRCDEGLGAGRRTLESSLLEVMGQFLYDSVGLGEESADDVRV